MKKLTEKRLEKELIEGYKARRLEDLKISQEWECTLLDGLNECNSQKAAKLTVKRVRNNSNA